MKIKIVSVGQFKNNKLKFIFNDYVKKLPWKLELKEIKQTKDKNQSLRKENDSLNLFDNIGKNDKIICLDKSGATISTQKLTQYISEFENFSMNISFIIGGPEGISKECLGKCDRTISFGKVTWPHLLVRVMLAEQLYRVSTIISNHPYHRN